MQTLPRSGADDRERSHVAAFVAPLGLEAPHAFGGGDELGGASGPRSRARRPSHSHPAAARSDEKKRIGKRGRASSVSPSRIG